MTKISYQLYCSRNFPPLEDTLQMLSETGFKEVEGFGGLFDDLDGLKAGLDATGLKMTSSHFGLDMVEGNASKAIAIAKELGIQEVIVPFVMPDDRPVDAAGWAAFGTRLAEAGKPFQDAGLVFGWHNHDFEFVATETGELPLDLIAAASDALMFELDLGWVARARLDPVAWIQKYAGRIAAAHIKDIARAGENADEDGWADVGHGTQDWAAIHAALQEAGVDHYVVEHDNPKDHARFASRSLAAIQKF
ncbi:sugar phosphate isomerase/epimerase [Loktanella sp. D2R18]|uniref:sugar phosphate isomerase/epimerase family protein n=1 Tax=Rhodobacterales TaxID=204455 RepID=UPI000DE90C21|nr:MULTISPECIES: sugar phosphate isomerase/epimerase [Rhodobacterales]MDO6590973.1 sugar phosphate isomerase/epimerase [Yoonia sp. 1_MG-2023]RBW42263.1 sugar phosphate isomerase/epimerase [Loktanella sp. D2R18]